MATKKKDRNVLEQKITLGRDDNGNIVRKSVYGKTKAELNKKALAEKQKWDERVIRPSGALTVAGFSRKWFQTYKASRSLNTRAMYENLIEKHIIPEFGDLYFDEISLDDIQRFMNSKRDKAETCKKLKMVIKQLFTAAQAENYPLQFSTTRLSEIAISKVQRKKEKRPLTEEEVNALFQCNSWTEEQKVFTHLLYYTGMRREEALPLRPKDINFPKKTISITRTVVFDDNNPVLKDGGKSKAAVRKINIPLDCVKELQQYIEVQKISSSGLLFPMPSKPNTLMSLSSYIKFWQGIQHELGIITDSAKELTAHYFRHNYATILYYSGISLKKAVEILGHEDSKMIMEVYAHLDEERELTDDKIEAFFSREKEKEQGILTGDILINLADSDREKYQKYMSSNGEEFADYISKAISSAIKKYKP